MTKLLGEALTALENEIVARVKAAGSMGIEIPRGASYDERLKRALRMNGYHQSDVCRAVNNAVSARRLQRKVTFVPFPGRFATGRQAIVTLTAV